jgi:hypothetical protein
MRTLGLLLLAALLGACAAPPARAPAPGAPTGTAKKGDCALECLRWTEQCNADPRGVYRCQHVCERFGEHCE